MKIWLHYLSRNSNAADSLFQVVVNRQREVPGSNRELAEALNNLGYIKIFKGEFTEALELYREASEIFRETSGDVHRDVSHHDVVMRT